MSRSLMVIVENRVIHESSNFMPISQLFKDDADTTLIFLSGDGVLYSQPSSDEWYRNQRLPWAVPSNPNYVGLIYRVAGGGELIRRDRISVSISSSLLQLGSKGLASQRKLRNGVQGPLAPDQWKQDISHLFNISTATVQALFVDTAFGPTDPTLIQLLTNHTTPYSSKLCNSQKIRSTAYGSFSVFGLCFTFVLGSLLTLASYLLEPISSLLYTEKGYNKYAHVEWTTNATLQLQRLTQEEIGMGTWSKCLYTIPVTKPGEPLGSLDLKDPDHPTLSLAHEVDDESEDVSDETQGSGNISHQGPTPDEQSLDQTQTSSKTSEPKVGVHEACTQTTPEE
ncbi:hypothetical protein F4805DRAFT_455321 [Annulohypoxylon moriforme]|nr:hypothetical protein F4805DRAFT_455321 [Annulohypoxylon moriforme]